MDKKKAVVTWELSDEEGRIIVDVDAPLRPFGSDPTPARGTPAPTFENGQFGAFDDTPKDGTPPAPVHGAPADEATRLRDQLVLTELLRLLPSAQRDAGGVVMGRVSVEATADGFQLTELASGRLTTVRFNAQADVDDIATIVAAQVLRLS